MCRLEIHIPARWRHIDDKVSLMVFYPQGGVSDEVTLTAYITATFLENKKYAKVSRCPCGSKNSRVCSSFGDDDVSCWTEKLTRSHHGLIMLTSVDREPRRVCVCLLGAFPPCLTLVFWCVIWICFSIHLWLLFYSSMTEEVHNRKYKIKAICNVTKGSPDPASTISFI